MNITVINPFTVMPTPIIEGGALEAPAATEGFVDPETGGHFIDPETGGTMKDPEA